ncbi:endonuclease/exonuclease/phosphatase family protein [Bauldia sp.]|uniref:endonuclease/exonuclease/phosphatase family protein n=1 Tax=Bauldia sp. TaxID=2575872 RepID=UPI003BA92958
MKQALTPAQPAPLPAPSVSEREALRERPRTEAVHGALMAELACMCGVEAPPASAGRPLAFPLRIAAWNIERGYFPEETADLIARTEVDVALLSEVDNGMARTNQRHVTAEIADRLGMGYAYGVEFLELDLGSERERHLCTDDFNAKGFHGNAVLAATHLYAPALLRFDDDRLWFAENAGQPRIGGRCAIIATVRVGGQAVAVASVHLESRGDSKGRARQMAALVGALDVYAGGLPTLIGGDLNTGLSSGDFEEEELFDVASDAGYARHGGPIDQMTTRASRTNPDEERAQKLDWFLTRGLDISGSRIVPALAPDGTPLSDHEMIVIDIAGLTGGA